MTMRRLSLLIIVLTALAAFPACGERIKEVASIAGVRPNQLIGYGLVVGLDGTGDQTTQTPFTLQSVMSMLNALGIAMPSTQSVQLRNTAAVIVTATLPAFARPGQQIDVTVSSIGNARSLRGGTLLLTPLRGANGEVFALAQGNVAISGASAAAPGARVTVNHLSAGRVPSGAIVERALAQNVDDEFIQIELSRSDFSLARNVADAIRRRFGDGVVLPLDGRTLQVRAPAEPAKRIPFLAELEELPVTAALDAAKVVVNSRTGSVVVNQAVQLGPCAVAHGSLTVRVSKEPVVSQPQPLSRGRTVARTRDQASIEQDGGGLVSVPAGASLDEVVRALNALGANPQDLIGILQAMRAVGALKADIEVI